MQIVGTQRWVGLVIFIAVVFIIVPALFYQDHRVKEVRQPEELALPKPVTLEVLAPPRPDLAVLHSLSAVKAWVVYAGHFSTPAEGQQLLTELVQHSLKGFLISTQNETDVYVGPVLNLSEANQFREALKKFHNISADVLPYDPLGMAT